MEETRIIKRVGNYSTTQAKPTDCILCQNALWGTVIIDNVCLECMEKDLIRQVANIIKGAKERAYEM